MDASNFAPPVMLDSTMRTVLDSLGIWQRRVESDQRNTRKLAGAKLQRAIELLDMQRKPLEPTLTRTLV